MRHKESSDSTRTRANASNNCCMLLLSALAAATASPDPAAHIPYARRVLGWWWGMGGNACGGESFQFLWGCSGATGSGPGEGPKPSQLACSGRGLPDLCCVKSSGRATLGVYGAPLLFFVYPPTCTLPYKTAGGMPTPWQRSTHRWDPHLPRGCGVPRRTDRPCGSEQPSYDN